MVESKLTNYQKGFRFQEHIRDLLAKTGYLEGQIYSTGHGLDQEVSYKDKLDGLGYLSYTSPDIMIINGWVDANEPLIDIRYGVSCSMRNRPYNDPLSSEKFLTIPTYQINAFKDLETGKNLKTYFAFGIPKQRHWEKFREDNYSLSVATLEDIGHVRKDPYRDGRAQCMFSLEDLMSWDEFVGARIDEGDEELGNCYLDEDIPIIE